MSRHPTDRPGSFSDSHDEARSRRGQLPHYRLILHAGTVTDLMFVVRTVMELTRLCRAEATHKMWEAYHCGRSQVLTTFKERAELYVEQFADKGLMVTIEPAQ